MTPRPRRKRLAFTAVLLGGLVLLVALCYVLSPDVRVGWVRVLTGVGADDSLAGMAEDVDKDVRAAAVESLIGRGDRSVPALGRRLARPDANERATACRVLGRIGPPARDAAPALKRLVRDDSNPGVRSQAALAFALVGRTDPEVTAELVRLLKSPVEEDRGGAAFACRMLGADAKHAVPALTDALRDPEPEVREAALKALIVITNGLGDADAPLRDPGRAAVSKAMAELRAARPPGSP